MQITNTKFNDGLKQTINARDLHVFLESKQDFSAWIKVRIQKYGFVENEDFIKANLSPQKNGVSYQSGIWGGQNKIDYHITLDMAKELAMVENKEKIMPKYQQ